MRLSSSDLKDDRWTADNFAMQRVRDVMEAMKWLEESDAIKHNISSVTTAKLCMVVIGALAGKKAKARLDDFLPFDMRKIRKENGITEESLTVLRNLMKARQIDGRVIALLADELKLHSNRGEDG